MATTSNSAPLETSETSVLKTTAPGASSSVIKRWLPLIVFMLLLAIGWETIKFIGGQAWRIDTVIFGQTVQTVWKPPLKFQFANDLNMPHLWEIVGAFARPSTRGGPPVIADAASRAFFTFRVALIGFALGTITGLTLAILFIYSKLLNRVFVPYIVASQTVPILVVAPMVVIWLRAGWLSIAIIAAYLTFFPVTISALRGLRSIKPEMMDLMRTYGASPLEILLKLRLPAALSYIFVGFKIAATASIIGTIVGELPSGISEGLGSLVLTYAQYYSTGPAKLWACIIVVAVLGISTFILVHIVETLVLRDRAHHKSIA